MFNVVNTKTGEVVKSYHDIFYAWQYIYDNFLCATHTVKVF